eukprot:scaffold24448_cov101-Isochrysis_galbana.AAC.1
MLFAFATLSKNVFYIRALLPAFGSSERLPAQGCPGVLYSRTRPHILLLPWECFCLWVRYGAQCRAILRPCEEVIEGVKSMCRPTPAVLHPAAIHVPADASRAPPAASGSVPGCELGRGARAEPACPVHTAAGADAGVARPGERTPDQSCSFDSVEPPPPRRNPARALASPGSVGARGAAPLLGAWPPSAPACG